MTVSLTMTRKSAKKRHMLTLEMFARLIRESFAALGRAWSQLWFQSMTTMPLEIARMGLGAALLVHYSLAIPYLFEFWSDAGFMPLAVALQYSEPWAFSLFFYFSAPWQLVA